MIVLDDDPQKQEVARKNAIRRHAVGVPVIEAPLPVDCSFYGLGPEKSPAMIGVEFKKPNDLARSIVQNARLINQFRNAVAYGHTKLYLLLEGIVRPNSEGLVEHYTWVPGTQQQGWVLTDPIVEYRRWDNFLTSLETKGGIGIKKSASHYETAFQIVDLYHWHQKPWEEHDTLDRFYTPVFLGGKPPLLRKLVKELDGISWDRSLAILNDYRGTGMSIADVFAQDAKGWQRTRGIGKGIATAVEQALKEPL